MDEHRLSTNILIATGQLEALLKGHIRTRLVSTDGFREEMRPTYPFEALREACMNAMMSARISVRSTGRRCWRPTRC